MRGCTLSNIFGIISEFKLFSNSSHSKVFLPINALKLFFDNLFKLFNLLSLNPFLSPSSSVNTTHLKFKRLFGSSELNKPLYLGKIFQ